MRPASITASLLAAITLAAAGGCVDDPNDSVSTSTDELTTLVNVNHTTTWNSDITGAMIWPESVGNIEVFLRRGETTTAAGIVPTQTNYLAFVVWNGSVVGRIFK